MCASENQHDWGSREIVPESGRILVVGDDTAVNREFQAILRREGYRTAAAEMSGEGLALALEDRPGRLIEDWDERSPRSDAEG